MPRKAEWTNKLDEAIAQLRQLQVSTVDRAGVERLFGVSPRQALRILHGFSPDMVGKNLAVDRVALIAHLEALQAGEPVQREQRRLRRVSDEIDQLRRGAQARKVPIPESQPSLQGQGTRLEPGRLEIRFTSGEDLLGKLLELARAVAEDPEQFRTAAGDFRGAGECNT